LEKFLQSAGSILTNAKMGIPGLRIGLGCAKSHSFHAGQCPMMKYNRQLMQCILNDKIANAVKVQTIAMDWAPTGYEDFDKGAAKRFVIDPTNDRGVRGAKSLSKL
jgi:glutathione-independent formaldehyde dehydrogenase